MNVLLNLRNSVYANLRKLTISYIMTVLRVGCQEAIDLKIVSYKSVFTGY